MKIILSFFFAASLVACGSSDDCARGSKCSADPVPTDAEIKTCKDAAANSATKCVSEAKAVSDCQYNNTVCGTDNKSDGVASLAKVTENCKTQNDAYATCIAK